jgi:hypothetical protein
MTPAELEKDLEHAKRRALSGRCSGGCGEHSGDVSVVRVKHFSGTDWGYFAYCESAVKEDISRGLTVEKTK